MASKDETTDGLNDPNIHLPATIAHNSSKVRRSFWRKLRHYIARIPFANDLAAAYFCAIDPLTPLRVRAILMAALAYFVMPADMIPDFIAGIGFSDDATVLATAIGIISAHIKQHHRDQAEKALGQSKSNND